jgi:hypothetical protein
MFSSLSFGENIVSECKVGGYKTYNLNGVVESVNIKNKIYKVTLDTDGTSVIVNLVDDKNKNITSIDTNDIHVRNQSGNGRYLLFKNVSRNDSDIFEYTPMRNYLTLNKVEQLENGTSNTLISGDCSKNLGKKTIENIVLECRSNQKDGRTTNDFYKVKIVRDETSVNLQIYDELNKLYISMNSNEKKVTNQSSREFIHMDKSGEGGFYNSINVHVNLYSGLIFTKVTRNKDSGTTVSFTGDCSKVSN